MKKVRPKRLKLDKTGRWHPQYKGWFFWHPYINHMNVMVTFWVFAEADEFLQYQHLQEESAIKRYNEQRIVSWEPPK